MAIDNRILVEELIKIKANFRRSLVIKDAVKLIKEEFPNWTTEEYVMVMRILRKKYEFFPENLVMAMNSIYYNKQDENKDKVIYLDECSPMPKWVKSQWDELLSGKHNKLEKIEENNDEEELPF